MRSYMRLSFVLFISFFLCAFIISDAYCANATRMIGYSARDEGMAGATTASAEDTSCLVKNPAGLVKIGNRVDVSYENILLHDVTLHTEGASVIPGVNYTNAGLTQTSNINYIPGCNAGVSYRIPGTEQNPVSVGFGIFTIGGMADNYPSSRLNTAILANGGNYDKMLDMRTVRFAPGLAAAFNDKLSVGIAANIDMQALRTNLARAITPAGLTLFAETSGAGDWDITFGGGFTAGLYYDVNDMINLGVSYESHNWQGHHYKYKDCLPLIDGPQLINMGVSVKPIKSLEITYDTRYINWTNVKIARVAPKDGGFGWRDQWVFALGSEYTTFEDRLKLRLGYMYGKSPIQPNVLFANSLMPVILEHHLTTGFSFFITKNLSLDFAWEHHFKNVMADDGGDSTDLIGQGTKVTSAADVISAGFGYKF